MIEKEIDVDYMEVYWESEHSGRSILRILYDEYIPVRLNGKGNNVNIIPFGSFFRIFYMDRE